MLKRAAAMLLLGTICARGASAQSDPVAADANPTTVQEQASGLQAEQTPAFDTYEWVERPRWTGRLGATFLQRGRPSDTPYIINSTTGDSLISPSGFDFPFQGGADIGLIRHGERADVEFRYFGVNQWSASQGPFLLPPGASLAVSGTGGGSPDPLTVGTDFTSNLNSVEANLRRNVSQNWSLLAGFRYLWLRDRMGLLAVDNVNPSTTGIDFRTSNRLYGFQVGADGILWSNGQRFHIEGAIKAGLYGNNANSSVTFLDTSGAFTAPASHAHMAFVGDSTFTGVYQLNDSWALRGGYQLLWLSGVAVAPEQLHVLDFNGGSINTNVTHSAFFHGALLGVERTW